MKKNYLILILVILLIGGGVVGLSSGNFFNKKILYLNLDRNLIEAHSPYSDNLVCKLKISTVVELLDGDKIGGEVNIDNEPTTLTFVDINTDNPSMVGNFGDRSPLAKIDNGPIVYFVERTDFGNLNIFTLFRDKNIMLMSKQYDLFGKPFGLMMVGDCLSGM